MARTEENRITSPKMKKKGETCNCGREDWVYDAEVGQWCCGCGYVKNATGKGFKEWGWTLNEKKEVVYPDVDPKKPLSNDWLT